MMTPGEVLISLTRRGIVVRVEGDRLFVDPVVSVRDDERAVLRTEKARVIAGLRLLHEVIEASRARGDPEADLADFIASLSAGRGPPPAPMPETAESLLDYAGRKLGGWHPDWPEDRPSAFPRRGHAYYTLGGKAHRYEYDLDAPLPTPTPPDELKATPVPAKVERWAKQREQHLNVCGECSKRFTASTAQASADMLRQHVEDDPCEDYATPTPAQLLARAWQGGYRQETDRRKAEGYAAPADAEHLKRTIIPGSTPHEQFRLRSWVEMEVDPRAE